MANSQSRSLGPRIGTAALFAGQFQHALFAITLGAGALVVAQPAIDGSSFLGTTDQSWFVWSLGLSIMHQIAAWFVLRTELRFRVWSRAFGGNAIGLWTFVHATMLAVRIGAAGGLSLADAGSTALGGPPMTYLVGGGLLALSVYGIWRAVTLDRGVLLKQDHFRAVPLESVPRVGTHPLYALGLLAPLAFGVMAESRMGLAIGLFQYTYAWVHYYCTEAPGDAYLNRAAADMAATTQ